MAAKHADAQVQRRAHEIFAAWAARWNACYFAECDRLFAEAGKPRGPWPKPAGWGLAPIANEWK